MPINDLILSFVTALIVSGAGWLAVGNQNKKTKSEFAKTLQDIANQATEDYRVERIERKKLERRLDETDSYIDKLLHYIDGLLSGIKILMCQLKDNNIKPDWTPGERPTMPKRKVEAEE